MRQVGITGARFFRAALSRARRVSKQLNGRFLMLLATCYALGVMVPRPGLLLRQPLWTSGPSMVVILMASLLFVLGLKIQFNTIAGIAAWIPRLDVFVLGRLTCIAIVLAANSLAPVHSHIIAGLLIVLGMPSAGSSAAWCLRVGGESVVCASLIVTTTIGYFALFPWLTAIELPGSPNLVASSHGHAWISWGWLPLILGISTSAVMARLTVDESRTAQTWCGVPALIGLTAVLLLNYTNASSASELLRQGLDQTVVLTIGLTILTAILLARISKFFAQRLIRCPSHRASATLATSMSNTGLAMAFILEAGVSPIIGLTVVSFTLGQHLAAAIENV